MNKDKKEQELKKFSVLVGAVSAGETDYNQFTRVFSFFVTAYNEKEAENKAKEVMGEAPKEMTWLVLFGMNRFQSCSHVSKC